MTENEPIRVEVERRLQEAVHDALTDPEAGGLAGRALAEYVARRLVARGW